MLLNSNDILAPIGARRGTSSIAIILQIMTIVGIGMLPTVVDKYHEGKTLYIAISLLLIFIPVLVFFFVKNKEMILISKKARKKKIVIMPMLSNIGLANKILALYRDDTKKLTIRKIYLLKTSNFPDKNVAEEIISLLKGYGIDVEIIKLKSIDNPKEIQLYFNKIIESFDTFDECAVNIISGKATTSIFLYELANSKNIEVHYISSKYDRNNEPVYGTEVLSRLDYEYLDS